MRCMSSAVSPLQVFRVFFVSGAQSFGGGTATLYLIRRAVVETHGWLNDAEFTRYFTLCHITPGINLLALAVLIGRRTAGAAGIVAALAGMLLPSAAIAILLTAGYVEVKDHPLMRAALRGIVPATIGFSLIMAYRMAASAFQESREEGRGHVAVAGAVLTLGVAMALFRLPVLLVLMVAGVAGALGSAVIAARAKGPAEH